MPRTKCELALFPPALAPAIEFTVPGPAPTKGSQRPIRLPDGRTILISDNKRLRPWTTAAKKAALACEPVILHKPKAVRLEVWFTYRRPKSVTRGELTVRPDVDKLVRALLDALKSICFADDAQVVRVEAEKGYGAVDQTVVRVSQFVRQP